MNKNPAFGAETMSGAARDSLWCMFRNGPTWDGNVPFEKGYADRGDGWNWLTSPGVLLALELGMGRRKGE